ncbi:MAG: lytic transglycosylase domain-containing protein [Thermodesulfobacteriota bacterium]
MRRADSKVHDFGNRLFRASLILPLLISIIFPEFSSANSYYYKKDSNGVVYYTNIDPKSSGYKKIGSPWGTFRGTPKSQRGYLNKYKYSDKFDEHINSTAGWYGIDPLLIKAMIKVESNFNPEAVSPQGAMGVMQLMPATADRIGVSDPFDPVENIEGGVKYFSMLMNMFNNNTTLAIAGYNAGENAVIKYDYKIPPYEETIEYVNRVYAHYDYLKKHPGERNFDSMIASRKDGVKSPAAARKSFVYVETLGGRNMNGVKTGASDARKKPVLTVKAENTEKKTGLTADKKNTHDVSVSQPVEKAREGQYAVQLASFPDLQLAKEMEESLKSKTYPAYIETVDLPGKGTWYRVKVGGFPSKDEAKRYGNDIITAEPGVKSVLVTLN